MIRELGNRSFGVELEITGTYEHRAVDTLVSAGIEAELDENCDEVHYRTWIAKDESTIDNGCEVTSPVLRGEAGIREVEAACRLLRESGASADKLCGLHVHVGTDDFLYPDYVRLIGLYTKFEEQINKFVHSSRNNNHWCYPMAQWHGMPSVEAVERGTTPIGWPHWDVERYRTEILPFLRSSDPAEVASGIHDLRLAGYCKVSAKRCRELKTLEFRHHHGTCEALTVTNWVRFVVNLVNAAKEGADLESPLDGLSDEVRAFYLARAEERSREFSDWL